MPEANLFIEVAFEVEVEVVMIHPFYFSNLIQDLSWYQWALALLAVAIVGISKAGIKGISIVVVALLAIAFGGKASTGILLPMLIVGDIIAVIYYRRHVKWRYLLQLLPWMMLGVVLGTWVGKDISEVLFKRGMAAVILVSVAVMYWWDRRESKTVPDYWWFGGIMGLTAGFTTMIGNLAGAFANIVFLAMRMPKNDFIGTASWLFLIINIFKMPFHIFVWKTITPETLALNLRLAPAVFIGFMVGIRIVKLINEQQYRQLILALTAIGAILIFFR